MPKTKSPPFTPPDTKEARLEAAERFSSGDRVRHLLTDEVGYIVGINLGSPLVEVWVSFKSATESTVPVACNPFDLELVKSVGAPTEEMYTQSEPSRAEDTPVAAVEVVPELTQEEAADRQRLEIRVERAFYEAGAALRELRARRLYRSTHRTFEEYCRVRFGFTYRHGNQLIAGSLVIENLQLGADFQNHEAQMGTNRSQIWPTKLEQVKPLTALEPDEQRQVWEEAVKEAGGKVPSGRIVKSIVERLKERDTSPPPIPYQVGEVVEIRAGCNPTLRKHDGCWGIITHVGNFSCSVHISVRNVNVRCRPDEMDLVDPKYTADIRAVNQRIAVLKQRDDLSSMASGVLEMLGRKTCFSPDDLWFLSKVEERYGIK